MKHLKLLESSKFHGPFKLGDLRFGGRDYHTSLDLEHLQHITHISYPKHTLAALPVTIFIFLVMIVAAYYQNSITKNRIEEKFPSFW